MLYASVKTLKIHFYMLCHVKILNKGNFDHNINVKHIKIWILIKLFQNHKQSSNCY